VSVRRLWGALALLGALAIVPGCPDEDADDDSAPPGDDDDVMADESDISVTAASPCAPLQSVFWKDYGLPANLPVTLMASTVPGTCALTRAYEEAQRAAADENWDAYQAAMDVENGPDTCAALLAYYTRFLPEMAALWPGGSCVVSVTFDRAESGSYVFGDEEDGVTLTASYSQGMDVPGILAVFDHCQSVATWDDWLALKPIASAALQFDGEIWTGQSGTVALVEGEDAVFGAEGMNLAIVENYSGEPGTLTATLVAPACDLPGTGG
jgi:hypothetical protein